MEKISRRDFLKVSGAGAVALGAAACKPKVVTAAIEEETTTEKDYGPMEMRYNQNSGDSVSVLGYGCMRWQMKKDENGNDVIDQDSVNELVDYAIAHGVNYFDTSPVYLRGQSEEATAKALLRHPRDKYFIATKLSNFSNWSLENSKLMYHRSFDIFQTDHIDYYLLHSIGSTEDFYRRFGNTGIMEFLLKERELGHIRNLGFSIHASKECFDDMMALHEKYHWDFVQIQMNYLDWTHSSGRNCNAKYLYEELAKRDIPVVIMEPLLGGRLSNVPDAIAAQFKQREPSLSTASWAFRFCATYPRVLCALSGMTYMEHLQDNLRALCSFKPLNEDELAYLEEMAAQIKSYPLVQCNLCQYCMPCPYGIDIPGIFKFYNSAVNEGRVAVKETQEQKEYRRLKRRYILEYNKSIPTIRQADHCAGCNQCIEHCPQKINIPRELQRIDKDIETFKRDI